MSFSAGTYAKLTPDLLSVEEIRVMPAPFEADESRILPVVMTAQPAFNAATQKVVRTGWVINGAEVNPVWAVVALDAAELDVLADDAEGVLMFAAYQTFRDGNATNAQAQRAIAWLIKQEAIRRGLA